MKYIPEVFTNGRVVLINDDDFSKAIENGQEIWVFCGGWSGGYARAFGATFDGEYWQCYSYEIEDKVFTPDDMKKCYKLIITDGIRVFMKTGEIATEYSGGFIDGQSKPEYNLHRGLKDLPAEEYDHLRHVLDVDTTLRLMASRHYEKFENDEDLEQAKKDIQGILH